MTSHMTETAEA